MNYYILGNLLIVAINSAITFHSRCNCEDFSTKIECNNVVNCAWQDSSCGLKPCVNINLKRCETLFRCSINQNKICEDTEDCSIYTADVQIDCMFKRGNCAAEREAINGKYKCKNYEPIMCKFQTADYCNNSYESENTFCWLNQHGKCQGYDPTTCTGIPLEICSNLGCDDSGYECQQYICQSHLSPSTCYWAEDGYFGIKTLCSWNEFENICEERNDLNDLTEYNCSFATDGGFHWIDGQCKECVASEEENLFSLLTFKIAIMILTLTY